jgi:hypothetical protein
MPADAGRWPTGTYGRAFALRIQALSTRFRRCAPFMRGVSKRVHVSSMRAARGGQDAITSG